MDFASGEAQWRARLGKLRDAVRQELVTRQLEPYLPDQPARILDVGCGQGTQTLRMAARGHHVTALDSSREMLALLTAEITTDMRVDAVHGSATELPDGPFDVVLCHGVLMYFDDPAPVVRSMANVVRPGGLLSLLVRNGDALAMRPGLAGDWARAYQAFDDMTYANRIGVTARADRLSDLRSLLADHGLRTEDWYGVRVFTDQVDDVPIPEDFAALLACEERAGRTDPYRQVAALTHLIARRDE
ncbi:methyltransferase domain-containing protein [Microtetraspora malaysiensis]|uniref:methyltransferase domain-containing protein n=1 Tax=Microtetraspora malaysiensis TaxID=161358 RepID=UPI003D8B6D97